MPTGELDHAIHTAGCMPAEIMQLGYSGFPIKGNWPLQLQAGEEGRNLVHALLPFLFLLLVVSLRVCLHVVQAAVKVTRHLDSFALILLLAFCLVILTPATRKLMASTAAVTAAASAAVSPVGVTATVTTAATAAAAAMCSDVSAQKRCELGRLYLNRCLVMACSVRSRDCISTASGKMSTFLRPFKVPD